MYILFTFPPIPASTPTAMEERKYLGLFSFPLVQSPKESAGQTLGFLVGAERKLKYLKKVRW